MNSRQLRNALLDHLPFAAFMVAEENLKPRPGSPGFWDNPHAQRPLRVTGSPTIVALLNVLLDHLQETTGDRPKRIELLNLLIAEGMASLAQRPEFAGLRPKAAEWPDDI